MAVDSRAMTDAERWYRERYARTPERDALFTTVSGEPVEPRYTADDLPDPDQTGLSTAFDMPSLMGHDSDHPRSEGEVGREGVAIDTLVDMETLFGGIPMGEVSTSMTINAPAAIMLAFYVVVAEEQGVPPERLAGTIQTDILKEYIAQKEWCFPIDPA